MRVATIAFAIVLFSAPLVVEPQQLGDSLELNDLRTSSPS